MQLPDLETYSLVRAIRRACDRKIIDGVEGEVSAELAKHLGRPANGFFVPLRALAAPRIARRALDATAGAGALKTAVSSDYIDALRPLTMLSRLGATIITDLIGKFSIPRITAGTTLQWLTTDGQVPAGGNPSLDVVSFTPKFIAGTVPITRSFVVQSSPNAEDLVRDDMFRQVGVAIDTAGLNGTGADGTPKGVLNTDDIGTEAIDTNGGVPTWSNILALEAAVDTSNVETLTPGYITTPAAKALLRQTLAAPSASKLIWSEMSRCAPAVASNVVPSNLTKGSGTNLSALIFGNWSDLVIALWGGVEVIINPYSQSTSGVVTVSLICPADIELRHPESFAKIIDIDTSSIAVAS